MEAGKFNNTGIIQAGGRKCTTIIQSFVNRVVYRDSGIQVQSYK